MEELTLITQYLQGELDQGARASFESRLASDTHFAAQVADVRSDWNRQRLVDWLDGLLPTDEANELSRLLEVDPQLRKELQQIKNARTLLSTAHQNLILKDVEQIASQERSSPVVRRLRFRWWQVAAVVLLLVALCFYALYLPSRYSDKALYAKYIEYYPGQGYLMSIEGEQGQPSIYQQAFIYYDRGDYDEALSSLQQIPESSPYYEDIQFYLANTHMALGQEAEAIGLLNQLLQQSYSAGPESRIRWYLAMAYLGAGEEVLAIQQLEELQGPQADGFYLRKAQNLRSELKSGWRQLPGIK